jgi:hypothetical protein
MADRTYNAIDAKLYDEDWSKGARIVAGVLIARCPNQYGVFDFPMGFLKDFFQGIFTPGELMAFAQEWEASGFAKFYRSRSVIWIVKKWKRTGKPSDKHWQGLEAHLIGFPEVRDDFLSLYEHYWNGVVSPSEPHRNPLPSPSHPPVNPDSESDSDSDSEKKTTNLRPPNGDAGKKPLVLVGDKPKAKKPYIPIEEREAKTPGAKLVKFWHVKYREVHGTAYSGDIKRMGGQVTTLLRRNSLEDICIGMAYLLKDCEHDQYHKHSFDHFVKKASDYIIEAKKAGWEL